MSDRPIDVELYSAKIEVQVTEQDGIFDALVTLSTPRGSFEGKGHSQRHPDDPDVPLIGEELAIGRALHVIADQLIGAAGEAIEDHESRPIHLLETP